MDYLDHLSKHKLALQQELIFLQKEAAKINWESPQVLKGISLFKIDWEGGKSALLTFEIPLDSYAFKLSSTFLVKSKSSSDEVEGRVVDFSEGRLVLSCNSIEDAEWLRDGKLGLFPVPEIRTIERLVQGCEEIIERGNVPSLNASTPVSIEADLSASLNESQSNALRAIASSSEAGVIYGPPGTGKTTTLTHFVKSLAATGKKVLISGPSNKAVDELTGRLIDQELNTVRLGNPYRMDSLVINVWIDSLIKKTPEYKQLNKYKSQLLKLEQEAFKFHRNFDKDKQQERQAARREYRSLRKEIKNLASFVRKNIIEKSSIVTGTPMAILNEGLEYDSFDVLVFDEGSQALKAELWLLAPFAKKIVVAGDPNQLPPVVLSENEVLKESALDTVLAAGGEVHMLDTQYRMFPEIASFSNAEFYENKLQASVSWEGLDDLSPVEFIDTAGSEAQEEKQSDGSLVNTFEAKALFERYKELSKESNDVLVLSPYAGQVDYLKRTYGIDARTIDGSQGAEADVVLLSMVRNNESGQIGFLKDFRRFNVAITRAKRKLVVVGDSATLGYEAFYQRFLDTIEEVGAYRSVWEFPELM